MLSQQLELDKLRRVINENLRVQQRGAQTIDYVDVANALKDVVTKQNHVVFGRRGCGKTLLLATARKQDSEEVGTVYLNCEDYKQHTFPNVVIEILDVLFDECTKKLTAWFGKGKKLRTVLEELRTELGQLRESPEEQAMRVKEFASDASDTGFATSGSASGLSVGVNARSQERASIEVEYQRFDSKIRVLNLRLPGIKKKLADFFDCAKPVKCLFLQLDDFYHLPRVMQPHVIDYVHRLCKDVPIYFKIATLRHGSVLYADRKGQPTGAQERHDYQPINVDFTLAEFGRTARQLRQILHSYAKLAELETTQLDDLFMGEGFDRLVLASGGVPRDFLSLLLEILAQKGTTVERIGKDDVRNLSRSVWQRRIEELKADSQPEDQDALLRGIHAIRELCTEKKHNAFLVPDNDLQADNGVRELLNRLVDYRIIHFITTALTHKTKDGTFTAYMIDIGAYANLRKLAGRFTEVDIAAKDARERLRNVPVLEANDLLQSIKKAPTRTEEALLEDETDAG